MALGRAVWSKRATAEVQGECRAEGKAVRATTANTTAVQHEQKT